MWSFFIIIIINILILTCIIFLVRLYSVTRFSLISDFHIPVDKFQFMQFKITEYIWYDIRFKYFYTFWWWDDIFLKIALMTAFNTSLCSCSHGNKEVFSCQGIKLAVDWFLERGHRDITVFVPAWRKEQSRPDALITGNIYYSFLRWKSQWNVLVNKQRLFLNPLLWEECLNSDTKRNINQLFPDLLLGLSIKLTFHFSDQEILRRLEKQKILVFTPSRRVQGRRVVCYDDRFIVKLAYECDGIIVSNDNYRDLANEKPEWKKFIDERLLMYSFVNDK